MTSISQQDVDKINIFMTNMIENMKRVSEKEYKLSECLMKKCAKEDIDDLIQKSYNLHKEKSNLSKSMKMHHSLDYIKYQSDITYNI